MLFFIFTKTTNKPISEHFKFQIGGLFVDEIWYIYLLDSLKISNISYISLDSSILSDGENNY